MLEFIVGALTVIVVLVALLLIGVILIQPSSSGGGLGAVGGGISESVFGAGAGNILTKTTVILASVFLGLTLILAVLSSRVGTDASVLDSMPEEFVPIQTEPPVNGAAESPATDPVAEP